MPFRRSMWYLAALAVLGSSRPGMAREPEVEFSLKAGWVDCTIDQDGKPIPDALVRIMDTSGRNFAEGETDERGQGQFPVPDGNWFIVEIKTGKRTADAIRLSRTADAIQPGRVLLSYGLRPCCRVLARKGSQTGAATTWSPPAEATIWILAGTIAGALVCTVAIILIAGRRRSLKPF
jgi:hypothetical protein